MIRVPFRISKFVLRICLGGLALAGCATPATYERDYYILEAARQAAPAEVRTDATLEVRRFSVDAAFADKGLVYRLGEFKYESDYYHQFLIAPGIMITEKTRAWLTDAGLFAHVLPAGSRPQPMYTLEGNVTALYGDFRNESAPTTVMEIRFFLLTSADAEETVAFAETYRAAAPVPVRTADALVAALNEGLREILTRLEADLQRTLTDRTDTAATARDF
jgi:cholesterol transport system auxiliary component